MRLTPEQAAARIAALEAELAEMKDRWMRAEAENANVRARAKREVDETRQYAVQKFATDVVEAAENLKRGIDSLPPPAAGQPEIVAKVREGLDGVERSFIGMLERNGIRREDPVGQPFDPNLHQAMAEQESDRTSARHRDAGLDPGLDPERPAAAAGDGGRRQGPGRRTCAGQPGVTGAARPSRPGDLPDRTARKIRLQPLSRPAPVSYIHVISTKGRARCFGPPASAERSLSQ